MKLFCQENQLFIKTDAEEYGEHTKNLETDKYSVIQLHLCIDIFKLKLPRRKVIDSV